MDGTNGLSTSLVIFGASGDLTRRKLVPALLNQYTKGRLGEDVRVVGFSRRPYSHQEFRDQMLTGLEELAGIHPDLGDWARFSDNLWYVAGDLSHKEDFVALEAHLREVEGGPANRLYYMATSPSHFPIIAGALGKLGMTTEELAWRRVVVEKPFGSDLASANELNHVMHANFAEHQIFRIDHYLGKETAQNILYFRFLNTIFEPLWNRNYIDHVQITVAEKVDVGHRGAYYDGAGVVRDMFQNHLLQLLVLVAMEPPARFEAEAVRNEKVKLLRAVRPLLPQDTVRAQYEGYSSAEGVTPGSQTPTYAALKLYIDNWRWQGVPFYLRSGKAMERKGSAIVIEFKAPPHVMFELPEDYQLTPNYLSLCVQPDEGIHLRFETKVPDSAQETRSVDMDFHYRSSFEGDRLPDAYERLLLDALHGDASLFTRSDEIELAWGLVDPLLRGWEESDHAPPMSTYQVGSWGPEQAEAFIRSEGRAWRATCAPHE